MERLVIGIPARNEASTIADLVGALEQGAVMLGEGVRCELVLAYQPGHDDTLARWESHHFRLSNRVLHGPDGDVGKGRNVKRLISHAREQGAHLLLVDGDLSSYQPAAVSAFGNYGRPARGGLVLPLWCRPHGEGNSTDFLACPLIFSCFGARVRQPLAGQRLLSTRLLATLDDERLPDDYGIDVALTVHALADNRPVDQVLLPFPDHQAGTNSAEIMADVARTLLGLGAGLRQVSRTDVNWPDRWWHGQARAAPVPRSLMPHPDAASETSSSLMGAAPDQVRDRWCQAVAAAVRLTREGADAGRVATDLVDAFITHAEYRRRLDGDLDLSEAYVADLGHRMAALLDMTAPLLIAPHPDDEVLGGSAVLRDEPVTVVHVTDGVPPWIDARERSAVRSARRAECSRAWRTLSAEVECVQLGYPDLRAWQSVEDLAASLGEVAVACSAERVFLPAYQRGHPDHDATYLAGALAAESLAGQALDWRVYGLYGLDSSRRLRFGCLPAGLRGVVRRADDDLLSVKGQALREFTSQLWPDSALDRWLANPSPEEFAPLPRRWRRIPAGPSFYDEELGFARYGAGAAVVEATFAAALAEVCPGGDRAQHLAP